jgi:hypothetical protein
MAKSKITARAKAKKPGAQIVRAWFDTVINPLLRALEVERSHLEQKDWTWQFRTSKFEVLQPICAHMDVVPDNLEQFLKFHLEVKKLVAQHDERVLLLSARCSDLQNKLEHSQELASLYQRVTSPESLSRLRPSMFGVSDWSDENLIRSFFGAYPESDHLALLAQYVVNHTQELPYYYSTAPLWNAYRNEFLELLDLPLVRADEELAAKAGHDLRETVRRLTDVLRRIRERLSIEYDLPYVAATAKADAGYF